MSAELGISEIIEYELFTLYFHDGKKLFTKMCSKCCVDKPRLEFAMATKRRDGLQPYCKKCAKQTKKEYKAKNKIRVLPKNVKEGKKHCFTCKKQRDKIEFRMCRSNKDFLNDECTPCYTEKYKDLRKFMFKLKEDMGGACMHCKEPNLLVLEFDHLRDKIRSVSLMTSKKKMEEEAKKCQLLCVFCHNLKSMRETHLPRRKEKCTKDTLIKRKRELFVKTIKLKIGRCEFCERIVDEKNYSAFHFDHIDEKTKSRGISYLVNGTCSSEQTILNEIKKCRLLCANCHRLRTNDQYGFCS